MKKSENTRLLTSLACVLVALAIVVCGVFCTRKARVGGVGVAGGTQQGAAATTDKTKDSVVSAEGEGSTATNANQGGAGQASGSDASAQSNATVEQHFTMPEDAEYEPQEVLVRVPEGMTQEQLEQSLAGVPGVHVGQADGGGLVTLELEGDLSVEDAINQLLATGVVEDAQPNYVYYALDEKDSGVAGLMAALAAYDEQTSSASLVAMEDDDNNGDGNNNGNGDGNNNGNGDGNNNGNGDGNNNGNGDGNGDGNNNQNGDGNNNGNGDGNNNQNGDGNNNGNGDGQNGDGDQPEAKDPNDPLVPLQYYLDDMHVPEAWQLAHGEKDVNETPVTVAVLDVGFDADHEDLVDNVAARLNALDDSEDVANTASRSLHGTHVAGVISARANNELGIAGVSYNAQLALVRVADSDGRASSATLAHAYDWIADQQEDLNVRVVNVSLGAAWASSSYTTQDKLLMSKIDEAYANGIVTVAAAGNASSNKGVVPYAVYPGDISDVVSVINIDKQHNRASGSNYNREGERNKNISAPGTEIVSTYGSSYSVTYQDKRYYGYSTLTGTSTAAPSVSGILALEFAANPDLSAEEAVDVLYGTTTDLGAEGWDENFGYGEVMALDAVTAATGPTISGPRYLAVGAGDATFTVTGSEGVTWSFASSDANVVSIDAATGVAHPVAKGVADITAVDDNGITLTKTVSVFAGVQGSDTVEFGKTATYTIEKDMSDYQAWSWSTSDKGIAEIGNSSGILVPVSAGTVTVTASLVADPSLTFSKEVEVTPVNIAKATIKDIDPQTYTGSEIKPALEITYNTLTLVEGTHYTVDYEDNVEVGTAIVNITGIGAFTGATTTNFAITTRAAWDRYWGQNAIETGKAVVEADSGTVYQAGRGGTVILATSSGYWDALAAAGLAGTLDAPVLITNHKSLSKETKEEIERLAPEKALVMGGTAAISDDVLDEVKALVPDTDRVLGDTAMDTAVQIYLAGSDWSDTAIVATVNGYWDALSIAPYAWWAKAPIFLTNSEGMLSDNTLGALASGSFERVVIVGGTAAVSADVEGQLESIEMTNTVRLFGDTALDTCSQIATWEIGEGMGVSHLAVATSDGYWDALTGAAVCGKQSSVLVLVGKDNAERPYRAYDTVLDLDAGQIVHGHVLGGDQAVSEAAWNYLTKE